MSKYNFKKLLDELNDADSVTMDFKQIQELLNIDELCSSAKNYQAWWSSNLSYAGYTATPDSKNEKITFKKAKTPSQNSSSTTNNGKGKNPSNNKTPKKLTKEEIEKFRSEINDFLRETKADNIIRYYMKTDLATMTDMPFYDCNDEDRDTKPENKKNVVDIVSEYCELLGSKKKDFQKKLLYWLSKQQNQSMRKLSKQLNNGIWEHPIPLKYTREFLLKRIDKGEFDIIKEYLKFINENAPQIFLTNEHNKIVNKKFKDKMPDDWDWKTDNPFARYIEAGIFDELKLKLNIIDYKATQKLNSNWIKDNSSSHYFNESEQKGFILLEDSVTEIGDRAFENCSHLTSITISKFVTEIGNETFKGCTNLSEETKELLMRKHNYTDF